MSDYETDFYAWTRQQAATLRAKDWLAGQGYDLKFLVGPSQQRYATDDPPMTRPPPST